MVFNNLFILYRLDVLYTFINFGSILGSVLSSILYNKFTTYAYCLSSFVSIAGLLYTYTFLEESVVIKMIYMYFVCFIIFFKNFYK